MLLAKFTKLGAHEKSVFYSIHIIAVYAVMWPV